MKAAVSTEYGPPEKVVKVIEVDKPVPKDKEILVRVYASTVNRTDSGFVRAKPAIVRLFAGLSRPKRTVLGCTFAGVVEVVGDEVKELKAGDRVYGFDDAGFGGHGEYMTIPEKRMVAKIPKGVGYEEAAAIEGAHYALNFIRRIKIKPGMRILVHGATGAIGSAAVQLLKSEGVYVVATSTTKNVNLIKKLGADEVIDHEKDAFTKHPDEFDAVLDAVGKSSFAACKPLIKKGGLYVSSELGPYGQNPFLALVGPLYRMVGAKSVKFPFPLANKAGIAYIGDRLKSKELNLVIDRRYALNDIVKAYQYVETGQKTGNVLIKIK